MDIKVSVIIPVYETEKYIGKCLDSLINQTLKEIEIIAVNDGSKDNSQQVIESYVSKYDNIHGLYKENGGPSEARNFGIKKAKGEYLAFVDSDDCVDQDMLEKMYVYAKTHDLDIVVCDTYMDYPSHSYVLKADLGYSDDPVKSYILSYPNSPARLIKTDLMRDIPFKKGIWYEDLNLMPKLACKTNKIGFINEAYYHYIQRNESIMNQESFNPRFYDIFTSITDLYETFEKEGKHIEFHSELEYLFITHLQRGAVLRFVDFPEGKECLSKVEKMMKEYYPEWSKNPYLKKSSWKFRLVCYLGKYRLYHLIALIKRI